MEDIWLEEEMLPAEAEVNEIFKSIIQNSQQDPSEAELEILRKARGKLRVDRPRWIELDTTSHEFLKSDKNSRFYLVRLGFQFVVLKEAVDKGARITYSCCSARILPGNDGEPQPRVYELFPRDLYEGEPQKVGLKLGPKVKLGTYEVSAGELSTDFTVGFVTPVVVGWPGKDECEPYWELRPNNKNLLGVQHLWLWIEVPPGCNGVRLAVRADAELELPVFHRLFLRLVSNGWAERPTVFIK